jgi:hypothetical protein
MLCLNPGLPAARNSPKQKLAMSTPDHPTPPPHPRDVFVNRVETYTRDEPAKALSAAFGIGILLTLLPVGTFVSGIIRLLFLVARPVLLVLGLIKVADAWEARRTKPENIPGEEPDQPPI